MRREVLLLDEMIDAAEQAQHLPPASSASWELIANAATPCCGTSQCSARPPRSSPTTSRPTVPGDSLAAALPAAEPDRARLLVHRPGGPHHHRGRPVARHSRPTYAGSLPRSARTPEPGSAHLTGRSAPALAHGVPPVPLAPRQRLHVRPAPAISHVLADAGAGHDRERTPGDRARARTGMARCGTTSLTRSAGSASATKDSVF